MLSAPEGGPGFTQSDPSGQQQSQAPAEAGLDDVHPSQALPPPHSTGPRPSGRAPNSVELRGWLWNMFLCSQRNTGVANALDSFLTRDRIASPAPESLEPGTHAWHQPRACSHGGAQFCHTHLMATLHSMEICTCSFHFFI